MSINSEVPDNSAIEMDGIAMDGIVPVFSMEGVDEIQMHQGMG